MKSLQNITDENFSNESRLQTWLKFLLANVSVSTVRLYWLGCHLILTMIDLSMHENTLSWWFSSTDINVITFGQGIGIIQQQCKDILCFFFANYVSLVVKNNYDGIIFLIVLD